MKNTIDLKMTISVTAIFTIIMTGSATAAPQHDNGIVFRAERGDTFLNLFGPDWEKAYQQNQITVIRNGMAVMSPDILLEGMILRVGSDTHLMPRAFQRLKGLTRRRAVLRERLAELIDRPVTAGRAAELRWTLDDDLRYAADIDYLEREVDRLQTPALPLTLPMIIVNSSPVWRCVSFASAIAVIALVSIVIRRRRREGPTGDQRVHAALRSLDSVLSPLPPWKPTA